MKKKVLVVVQSYFWGIYQQGELRRGIMGQLKKDGIAYQKNKSDCILTEEVDYHFFQYGSNRNPEAFSKKHKNIDELYISNEDLYQQMKDEQSVLLTLMPKEKKVSFIKTTEYRYLLNEHLYYEVENVIELTEDETCIEKVILTSERKENHFHTEQEAKKFLQKEKSKQGLVEVYTLIGNQHYLKITVPKTDIPCNSYSTEDEAKIKICQQARKQIQELKKQIQEQEDILTKYSM